jgi:hypothetical protein
MLLETLQDHSCVEGGAFEGGEDFILFVSLHPSVTPPSS